MAQGLVPVCVIVRSREEYDRHVGSLANAAQQFHASHLRQENLKHYNVRVYLLDDLKHLLADRDRYHVVAVDPQLQLQDAQDGCHIVYDEDGRPILFGIPVSHGLNTRGMGRTATMPLATVSLQEAQEEQNWEYEHYDVLVAPENESQ
jgi:hypothetical protein